MPACRISSPPMEASEDYTMILPVPKEVARVMRQTLPMGELVFGAFTPSVEPLQLVSDSLRTMDMWVEQQLRKPRSFQTNFFQYTGIFPGHIAQTHILLTRALRRAGGSNYIVPRIEE